MVSQGVDQGVMHHFWVTGAELKVDRMWVSYYVDGEVNRTRDGALNSPDKHICRPMPLYSSSLRCQLAFPA